jgi:hypothetical protein
MNLKRFTSIIAALALIFCVSGTAMARDAMTQTRFITGFALPEPVGNFTPFVIYNYCNFADLSNGAQAGVTGGDVVQLLKIPAGTYVKQVGIMISTAYTTAGATCVGVQIGDGADVNGWLEEVDLGPTATGVSVSSGSTNWAVYITAAGVTTMNRPAYSRSGGSYYKSADTIDAVIPILGRTSGLPGGTSGVTNGIIKVWAEAIKMPASYNYKRP